MKDFEYQIIQSGAKKTNKLPTGWTTKRRLLGHHPGRELLSMRAGTHRGWQRGISLIEILITMAIAVFLGLMAYPNWTVWLANQQVRGATESVLDGIRMARTEAVKRNDRVRFVLDPATGWQAQLFSDDSVLRESLFKEGFPNISFTATPVDTDTVVFDGIGRVLKEDGTTPLDARITLDVASSKISTGVRALRIVIDTAAATGVGIRSCDPNLSVGDPRACPA